MTKLFIANCTRQAQVINYRVIEHKGVMTQRVEIGSQAMIATDQLTDPQIRDILSQFRKYGLLEVGEVGSSTNHMIPLVASIGSPVKADVIRRVMLHNTGVLRFRGKKMREEAAIAVNNKIEELGTPVDTLEMSVVEEKPATVIEGPAFTEAEDNEPIAEGVRVTRTPEEGGPSGRRGGRRRAA